jgi:hypothetical protein
VHENVQREGGILGYRRYFLCRVCLVLVLLALVFEETVFVAFPVDLGCEVTGSKAVQLEKDGLARQ